MTTRTTTRPRPTAIHHHVTSSGAYPDTDEAAGRCATNATRGIIVLPSPPETLANSEQVIDDARSVVNGGLQIPQRGGIGPARFQPPNRFLRLHADVAGEDQD